MSETMKPDNATKDAEVGGDGKEKKHRNWWIWVSGALGVIAVGLLIWGIDNRSNFDSSQDEVAQLESQADQSKQNGTTVLAGMKAAYADLTSQLGATQQDLAATEQAVKGAEQTAAQAQQDATAAQKDAANAKDQTEKQKAETQQAKAEAQAANSKVEIAADCAQAYASAFGSLFEGDSVKSQAAAAGEQLKSISSSCKAALGGA
jgi:chromosome segregation ATPase